MANWITNRTGATLTFIVSGTSSIGADFGSSYLVNSANFSTTQSAPLVSVTIQERNVFASVVGRVFPAVGRIIFSNDLDSSKYYQVVVTVTRLGGHVKPTRLPLRATERWREAPEEETSNEGPYGRFCQLVGLVYDLGAVVIPVEDDVLFDTPEVYEVLLVGGQIFDGVITDYAGEDSRIPGGRLTPYAVTKSFAYASLLSAFTGLSPSKRLSVLCTAYPEMSTTNITFNYNRQFPNGVSYASLDAFKGGDGLNLNTGVMVPTEPNYSYPGPVSNLIGKATLARAANISGARFALVVVDFSEKDLRNSDYATWVSDMITGLEAIVENIRNRTEAEAPVCFVVPPTTNAMLAAAIAEAATSVNVSGTSAYSLVDDMDQDLAPWGEVLSEEQHLSLVDGLAAHIATLVSADLEPPGAYLFDLARNSGLQMFLF